MTEELTKEAEKQPSLRKKAGLLPIHFLLSSGKRMARAFSSSRGQSSEGI